MLWIKTFRISASNFLVVVELGGVILGDLLADVGGQARHPDGIRPVKGVGQRLGNNSVMDLDCLQIPRRKLIV